MICSYVTLQESPWHVNDGNHNVMNSQDRHSEGSQGEPGQKLQALGPRHLHGGQGDHQGDVKHSPDSTVDLMIIFIS